MPLVNNPFSRSDVALLVDLSQADKAAIAHSNATEKIGLFIILSSYALGFQVAYRLIFNSTFGFSKLGIPKLR